MLNHHAVDRIQVLWVIHSGTVQPFLKVARFCRETNRPWGVPSYMDTLLDLCNGVPPDVHFRAAIPGVAASGLGGTTIYLNFTIDNLQLGFGR